MNHGFKSGERENSQNNMTMLVEEREINFRQAKPILFYVVSKQRKIEWVQEWWAMTGNKER